MTTLTLPTALNAGSFLNEFGNDELPEKPHRNPEVSELPKNLIELTNHFLRINAKNDDSFYNSTCKNLHDLIGDWDCNPKELETFTLRCLPYLENRGIKDYKGYSGKFVSCYINSGPVTTWKIPTSHLHILPDNLGLHNKEGNFLKINGDVGNCLGSYNHGTIEVRRNVGFNLGWYNKGTIEVTGNAGFYLGWFNEGTIEVIGNAGDELGLRNKGKIKVGGNVGIYLGRDNEGEIEVSGNAGKIVGYDNKGLIEIMGDAEGNIGYGNKCLINIMGDAGTCLGSNNEGIINVDGKTGDLIGYAGDLTGNQDGLTPNGGNIYLNGPRGHLSDQLMAGNIYHKGKLIVKDGEIIKW